MPKGDFNRGEIGSHAGDTPNRRRATDAMEKARAEVIAYLRQGKTPDEAMAAVGRAGKTFYTWMYSSPKFAKMARAAQEAWLAQARQSAMPWREMMDQFDPILRENYDTWTEYQVAHRKAYYNHDTFDHQWRLLEAMEKAPPGGITMILIPPEWTKSTVVLDTIGGDLCDKPNMRFAIVSEGQRLARKMLSRLQGRLAPDDGGITPLVEHFGPFKPAGSSRKPWNADEFTILGATHDEQDPSVLSIGITGAIRGYRWDRVILDDIQSLNNLSQTMTMIEKIRGDIASRPGRTGKLIVLGSRVGRTDVYAELERLEIIDELFIMQALDLTKLAGHQSNFPRQSTPDGAPILDEKGDQMGWNDEDLAQKRRIVGEDQWSRAYMQQPQSDFSALINDQDILNATDPTRSVGQPAGVANMAGEDPSLANHAAFAYCGYDADHLYVLDMVDLFKPTTNQNLFAEIDRGTIKYRPEWWVIEDNTLQSGYLTDDAFINLQKKWGFNAIGHYTGGTKADDKLGVPAMMSAIVRGEIVFPMIGDDHVGFARLFDQLKAWRPDVPSKRLVQDEVMALWFCYLLWRKLREQVNIDVSVWKRSGMAKPTMYPYARTNVEGIEPNPPSRMPMTYEQHWQHLTEEVSA
jgi:hypothetical protein